MGATNLRIGSVVYLRVHHTRDNFPPALNHLDHQYPLNAKMNKATSRRPQLDFPDYDIYIASLQESIPASLDSLQQSKQYVGEIVNYCMVTVNTAVTQKDKALLTRTIEDNIKKYVEDTTSSIAENIHQISTQLTQYLDFQEAELVQMTRRMESCSQRLIQAEMVTARSYAKSHFADRHCWKPMPKSRQLSGAELPKAAQPKPRWTHQPIDLN
eukprot:g14924.t1